MGSGWVEQDYRWVVDRRMGKETDGGLDDWWYLEGHVHGWGEEL
jgi:hypothetical protein